MATLSILFTDAVASTEALSRLGDERFAEVQEAHLGLLREALRSHDGREVKSLGDGLMVAFTGAAEALGCAVAMQQAVEAALRGGEEGLPLRVGVTAGDVTVADDGDVTGSAVVEAARLCAAAKGGQVLGSETLRALAGSRGGHVFTALGPVELKGLAEPVSVVEVGWSPVAGAGGLAPVPLPPRLAFESAWSFVGRAGEVERLEALWREVVAAVRVALLGGEPGAGKTRLARELAVRAHEQGALVLFGQVDEHLAVAYQPFAEALRHYLANVDEGTRERVLALRGGALARLVPELMDEPMQGQVEAWTIFEALVDWLSAEAGERPVVLVLDDVHWAAKPTLQALVHLIRSDRLSRLLIVATYRDTELDRKHPLSDVLADLRRVDGVERIAVRGLDADGVAAFVRAARGDELDDAARELAAGLSEQTQGNPFFVGQVLRHLAESRAVQEVNGRWVATPGSEGFVVPEGVREVVGRRVSRLSEPAGELLTVAAVTGPEFDTAVVGEVAGQPIAQALDGFDEALASRLVLETDAPGRLRFAHALVRQTLVDELSTMRRLHLHQQIGLALERRFGDADSAVGDLARHFAEAAGIGEGERAARYAERAAVQALDRGAAEQAADLFERALELLPPDADHDGLRRDRLYAQLARCDFLLFDQLRLEEHARAWVALGQAQSDEVMLADAATWLPNAWLWRIVPQPADTALLAAALRVDPWGLSLDNRRRLSRLGKWCDLDASSMRAAVLARIAASLALAMPLGLTDEDLPIVDPLALADEALRLAGQSTDPEIADEVRSARAWALSGSPHAGDQLAEAQRGTRFGNVVDGQQIAVGLALARLGRLDELRANSEAMLLLAEQHGSLLLHGNAHIQMATEAAARGRFDEAQATADKILASNPDQPPFQLGYALITIVCLLATGRPDDAQPLADLVAASPLAMADHIAGVVAVARGDYERPRAVLDAWHANGRPLNPDINRTGLAWGLAECAHAVGDREAARRLYDDLCPFDGQLLVNLLNFIPASAAFTLGLLAETLDDQERALAHYTDALALEKQCEAQPLAARTRQALTRLS